MTKLHTPFALLVCIALALVAGASPASAETTATFPHKAHLGEKLTCADCHQTAGERPTINEAACTKCHDAGSVGAKAAPKAACRFPLAFPHKRHADALSCADCHKNVESDAKSVPMTNAQCVSCHEANDIKLAGEKCLLCHASNPRLVRPADHAATWHARHGQAAEWRIFGAHGKDCELCHAPSTCVACHRAERPQSHTGLWRARMHGQAASFDRDRCKTCHETGSCRNCHENSAPQNHHGAWRFIHGKGIGTNSQDGCTVCHAQGCASCHRGAGGK